MRNKPESEFYFFRPDKRLLPGDGRDPRVPLQTDPVINETPTDVHLPIVLSVIMFVMYLASMSWEPFPGPPTILLLRCLDPLQPPDTQNFLWSWIMRGLALLPFSTVAIPGGVFSALCGALGVGILTRLMIRIGYVLRNEPGHFSFLREIHARRLSGVTAALFLGLSTPFWVAATRTLPDTFDLLLLLLVAWFIGEYRHRGRPRDCLKASLLLGVCLTEYPSAWAFLPAILFFMWREMFRWRSLHKWWLHALIFLGLLVGLLLLPLNAFLLFKHLAVMRAKITPVEAMLQVLKDQFLPLVYFRFSPGFLPVVALVIVPWLAIFVMSTRSPWFYEWGQVSVRLIFMAGFFAVAFNAAFAPWSLTGMFFLIVAPYVLLAVSVGYIAGEFWIMGEPHALLDTGFLPRLRRGAMSLIALLFPVVFTASAVVNWPVVDGRYSRDATRFFQSVFTHLGERDILFSSGQLDDSLRLLALEQHLTTRIVSAPHTGSSVYLNRLANAFEEEELSGPLAQGDFGTFLENLLMSEDGPSRIGIIDLPDVFREYGYLVPDTMLYRLEATPDRVDWAALAASQQPFWDKMIRMTRNPLPEKSILRAFENYLREMVSRVANNLAYVQLGRGDDQAALASLRAAHEIWDHNVSVLLNLLELARKLHLPEQEDWEKELDKLKPDLGDERWVLAIRYGYVWNPRAWMRRGHVWALSGIPATEEAARRKPAVSDADEAGNDNRNRVLDQSYLLWGQDAVDETFLRGRLAKNGRDTDALMALCRLALRRNDPEVAEAYIMEALDVGLPETKTQFDRAMLAFVQGDKTRAIQMLRAQTVSTPRDMRVWTALLLLTDETDPINVEALKTLKNQAYAPVGQYLALASIHMSRQQWADAQEELDRAIALDPRNTQAWEMMVQLAQQRGNRALLQAGLKCLQEQDPDHFLQYQNAGVEAYQKGNLALAEAEFRKGLMRRRDALLLNNLAHVIMERQGNMKDALKLVDEALLRLPGQPQMLSTRAEIYINLGRYADALQDLQESLRKQGRTNNLLLLLALAYEGLGDWTRAETMSKTLAGLHAQLTPAQRERLAQLQERLDAHAAATAAKAGEYQSELTRLEAALRAQPDDAALRTARATILLQCARYDDARLDLEAAVRSQGETPELLFLLVQAWEGAGNPRRALAYVKRLASMAETLDDAQRDQLHELRLGLELELEP
jgi:tetratricopeptide (TPR) repeat protein